MIPIVLLLILVVVILGVWQMSRPTTLHNKSRRTGMYAGFYTSQRIALLKQIFHQCRVYDHIAVSQIKTVIFYIAVFINDEPV